MGERERKHFEAIARAMSVDEGARIDEAMTMTALERVQVGLRLGAAMPTNDAIEAELDRRALEQAEIHLRLKRLARAKARAAR